MKGSLSSTPDDLLHLKVEGVAAVDSGITWDGAIICSYFTAANKEEILGLYYCLKCMFVTSADICSLLPTCCVPFWQRVLFHATCFVCSKQCEFV
jgi:hypothetical protein